MKFLLTPFLLVFLSLPLAAQFGLTGAYSVHNFSVNTEDPLWDPDDSFRGSFNESGYEAQLHYWFRLPNYRVEFQPTVFYGASALSEIEKELLAPDLRFQELGFQFEVNIYPFDFTGDCDCPKFGKQGPHLQKGFFIQLAPGVARRWFSGDGKPDMLEEKVAFIYGGGLGLDIGLGNFVTVTPLLSVRGGGLPAQTINSDIVPQLEMFPLKVRDHLISTQLSMQFTFRLAGKNY